MPRTIAKDHDDKRQAILAAAARCFASNGYDRASMAQVAAACGISKANIYHYYNSKDAMLFDLLDSYLGHLRDHICAVPRSGSPQDQLRQVAHAVMDVYRGNDDVHRVQLANLPDLADEPRKVLEGYQRAMVRHVSDILQDLAPGPMADKGKRRAVAMSIFAMLNWYYMWNSGAGGQARSDYADLVVDLVNGGASAV